MTTAALAALARALPRWTLAAVSTGCVSPWQPLSAPLPASHTLAPAAQLVVLPDDLAGAAATVLALANTETTVGDAAWTWSDWPGHTVAPWQRSQPWTSASWSWVAPHRLRLTAALPAESIDLSLLADTGPGCSVVWQLPPSTASVDIELGTDPNSAVEVVAQTLTWSAAGAATVTPPTCFEGAPPAAASGLLAHLNGLRSQQTGDRLATAAAAVAHVQAAPFLHLVGQTLVPSRWGAPRTLRLELAHQQAHVWQLLAGVAYAPLRLALDVERAGCAPDVPPPAWSPSTPPPPPPPPPQPAFVRRGLAIDRATLAHLGWAATRAGLLCQETHEGLPGLHGGWADAVVPGLSAWLDGPASGARLWPLASAELRVVDTAAGPGLEWRLDAARIEVTAQVGGSDWLALVVTGGVRAVVRPAISGAWQVVEVQALAPLVHSPLLGGSPVAGGSALDAVVAAAVKGIFAEAPGFSWTSLLPVGASVTGLARSGDALWLWLDGPIP
jgi:hypothetical protein